MGEYSGASIWKTYGPHMISVSVVIIGLIVFFAIIEFKLNSSENIGVEREGFENNSDNNMEKSFCKTHEGDRNKLQTSCSKLTKNNCLATSCCVYAKMDDKEQCHSGDISGPTFKRDENGKTKKIEYYHFRNNCFGNKCE